MLIRNILHSLRLLNLSDSTLFTNRKHIFISVLYAESCLYLNNKLTSLAGLRLDVSLYG